MNPRVLETGERRTYLTNKLQTALETTAPLLREIMTDFRSYLQKTLLGTHGQEIMNDVKGQQYFCACVLKKRLINFFLKLIIYVFCFVRMVYFYFMPR